MRFIKAPKWLRALMQRNALPEPTPYTGPGLLYSSDVLPPDKFGVVGYTSVATQYIALEQSDDPSSFQGRIKLTPDAALNVARVLFRYHMQSMKEQCRVDLQRLGRLDQSRGGQNHDVRADVPEIHSQRADDPSDVQSQRCIITGGAYRNDDGASANPTSITDPLGDQR